MLVLYVTWLMHILKAVYNIIIVSWVKRVFDLIFYEGNYHKNGTLE